MSKMSAADCGLRWKSTFQEKKIQKLLKFTLHAELTEFFKRLIDLIVIERVVREKHVFAF